GRAGEHGLDVVGVSLGQRNLYDTSLGRRSRHHSSFVTRIGSNVASLLRSEGDHPKAQRRRRSREGMDPIWIKAFLLSESMDEFLGEVVEVTPALRDDGGNGVPRGLAGAKRILIGVDHDRIFGNWPASGGRQHGFRYHVQSRSSGRELQKSAAGRRKIVRGHGDAPLI